MDVIINKEYNIKTEIKPLEKVYFHEVGAINSIVDILETAILVDKINPYKIMWSIVNDGYRFIQCKNGTIPVPVQQQAKYLQIQK